jgi:membrane protein required for colicin V production
MISLPFQGLFLIYLPMIIDIVVVLVVLSSALISFMRGFIREVLTIAGVVGGILAAVFLGPTLAPTVRVWFGVGEGDPENAKKLFDIIPYEVVADVTTYGAIFISVVIVLSVLSHFISGAAKAIGLGPVDRSLGAIFGVARGLVLLGLFYLPFHMMMPEKRKDDFFKDSQTHYFIAKISAVMEAYLPESGEVKEEADDLIKKKLEEQDLLGGDKKKEPEAELTITPLTDEKKTDGYKDEEREKLDKLFNEGPVTNE